MTDKKKEWLQFLAALRSQAGFGPKKEYRNADGQLHRDDGPAFVSTICVKWYRDGRLHGVTTDIYGTNTFYFRNVVVPAHYITQPEKLQLKDILSHPNTEVRRVGIEIYGLERIEESENCQIIDTDDKGQVLMQIDVGTEEPSTYVKVFNGTPEIDGTYKTYYLCVPPDMKTVKQAVAWTFRCDETEYNPQVET